MDWSKGFDTFVTNYWTFAFAIATGFYAALSWFGRYHLSQDKKDSLTLWLWGEYESTWSHQFCNLFDAVFGARHLSWRCFVRSSIASGVAVLALYFFLAGVLNVMDERVSDTLVQGETGDIALWQVVAIGALVNVIPDYVSLFETRWLLKRFERVRSVAGQLAVLAADAVFTGAIIWVAINAFQVARGETLLSAVDMLALFSVFSLFFYSTFLTSIWAWLYCLSTWFMRVFSRTPLKDILPLDKEPVRQIALVGSVIVLVAALGLSPVVRPDETQKTSWIDEALCDTFGSEVCLHVFRLSQEERQAYRAISDVCASGDYHQCYEATLVFFGNDDSKVIPLWRSACHAGHMRACNVLGVAYEEGRGVAQDDAKAVALYRQACGGGEMTGCTNVGGMYRSGKGVAQDHTMAVTYYRRACEGGNATGCGNLGWMYRNGKGVGQDDIEAAALYRRACDGGQMMGCTNLGWMFDRGMGVMANFAEAAGLYRKACDGGELAACTNLGVMYRIGKGVSRDFVAALALHHRACDGGNAKGCANLGWMYRNGKGVARNDDEARALYRRACDLGRKIYCVE